MKNLGSQQIKTLIEDRWLKEPNAFAVGLHTSQILESPIEVEFSFGKASVVKADTVFQIREALLEAEEQNTKLIILTKLQQGDLGNDIIGRFLRSRLFSIDHWTSLLSLFKAKELDRSICDHILAEALLEYAPEDGYPPVLAGVLDANTVWKSTFTHVFKMKEREPDLQSLLLWASKSDSNRYFLVSNELKSLLRNRLVSTLGKPASSILNFLDCAKHEDALPLAITCQVIYGTNSNDEPVLQAAAARMEQFHNKKPIDAETGVSLGKLANDLIAELDGKLYEDENSSKEYLLRADQLLIELGCEQQAYRNRLTSKAFEQRLSILGTNISSHLQKPTPESMKACEMALVNVKDHKRAKNSNKIEQINRAEMALRLLRWLETSETNHEVLLELAKHYRSELSFVDWARESICRGEDEKELGNAYKELDKLILGKREKFNEIFAKSFANWTLNGSSTQELIGVEDVISKYVAKLAKDGNKVLLIVMDGMSWPVCNELLMDLYEEHWVESTLAESPEANALVMAAIPSITQFSRTSLLSGFITSGDSGTEKKNFESNPNLKQSVDKIYPPILFHKAEITEGSRGPVSEELKAAILQPQTKVVGLVINAVDDRLNSAQQLRESWNLNRISSLSTILKLASDSERIVILTSDHGHVWHRAESTSSPSDFGSRWRKSDSQLRFGEIKLKGGRVQGEIGSKEITVPFIESMYYGKAQNGYHGGATPQEMICPLVILINQNTDYSGINTISPLKPEWWKKKIVATVKVEPIIAPVITVKPKVPKTLFDDLETTPETSIKVSDWITNLFASETYQSQKLAIKRNIAPEDSLIRKVLLTLHNEGGTATINSLCNLAEISPNRFDGLMVMIQRILNVDGYEILKSSRAENRVELNIPKLKRQFDLE